MRRFGNLPVLTLVLFSFAGALRSQETTGTITGLVSDPTGAVLPNADVTATNVGTNASYKAATNAEGNYIFRAMPSGSYRLTVSVSGFKRYDVNDVIVQVNEVTRVDVSI